jgi:hypothetical protein
MDGTRQAMTVYAGEVAPIGGSQTINAHKE